MIQPWTMNKYLKSQDRDQFMVDCLHNDPDSHLLGSFDLLETYDLLETQNSINNDVHIVEYVW